MVSDSVTNVLNIVTHSPKGVGWTIPKEWADVIITMENIELKQRHYNITGEKSALFQRNGETIRLEKSWTGRYSLYHGDWEPDPHWTGD